MAVIRSSDYKKMPWKNGLGFTAEIDRFPQGEGPYLWRLSRAEISAAGPFSVFAGFDRWLAVVSGEGLRLNNINLVPLRPMRFSGDEAVECGLLGGSVTDLGLIFDRSKVNAEMKYFTNSKVALPGERYLAGYVYDLDSGDTFKADGSPLPAIARGFLISVFSK
jgi:environmental stress-induced protein Ves